MSGLAGIIVMGLNFFDGLGKNANFDEEADSLEEKPNTNNNDNKYKTVDEQEEGDNKEMMKTFDNTDNNNDDNNGVSPEEFSKLQKLLKAGVSLPHAEAILKVIDIALNPELASPLPKSTSAGFEISTQPTAAEKDKDFMQPTIINTHSPKTNDGEDN